VHSHPSLTSRGSVESGALKVGIGLLVEFRFVLDTCCDSFVGVECTEFEVGDVALEEVSKVIRNSKTCEEDMIRLSFVNF